MDKNTTRATRAGWSPMARQRYQGLLGALPPGDEPLWAIVDCAVDEQLYEMLHAHPEQDRPQCLYDGVAAVRYARYAPYLLSVHARSPFVSRWLDEGWERHWGVFLVSGAGAPQLRRHFKRFLQARDAQGRQVWLRFYDPRVLPSLLAGVHSGNRFNLFGYRMVRAWLAPRAQQLWRGMPEVSDFQQSLGLVKKLETRLFNI